jgi:hypothetical protein
MNTNIDGGAIAMPEERQNPDRRTIYVRVADREMWERAEELAGDSLASLVADLLRRWVAEREAEAKARVTGMGRVEVTVEDGNGYRQQAFHGRLIATAVRGRNTWDVYLTPRGQLAVYCDGQHQQLQVYPDFETLASSFKRMPDLMTQVTDALGRKHVEELDI